MKKSNRITPPTTLRRGGEGRGGEERRGEEGRSSSHTFISEC